jgi:molecular chaperone DnaK
MSNEEGQKTKTERDIGIDLGTSNSVVSLVERTDEEEVEPTVLVNQNGQKITPSVVLIEDGDETVGHDALNQSAGRQDRTVTEIKRHMGDDYTIDIDGESYTPEKISSYILERLRDAARQHYDVGEAVITVPAYFTSDARQATREAGKQAGFDTVKLLDEPTAAAVAYGIDRGLDETIIVFDFGGGTVDISVLDVDDNVFTIKTTDGDRSLGGTDFTDALVDRIVEKYKNNTGTDLSQNDDIMAALWTEAEKAKRSLSGSEQTKIVAPFLGQIDDDIIDIEMEITRDEFEDATEDLRDQAIEPLEDAMDAAGLSPGDPDEVLLVGGSSRMPAIQDRVEDTVGVEPHFHVEPDHVVALGAALKAHSDEEIEGSEGEDEGEGTKISINQIIPSPLGTRRGSNEFDLLIPGDTQYDDAEKTKRYRPLEDNAGQMAIDVYQGDGEYTDDDDVRFIGEEVMDIREAPRDDIVVEITFSVDDDGVLEVEADEYDGDGNHVQSIEFSIDSDEYKTESTERAD